MVIAVGWGSFAMCVSLVNSTRAVNSLLRSSVSCLLEEPSILAFFAAASVAALASAVSLRFAWQAAAPACLAGAVLRGSQNESDAFSAKPTAPGSETFGAWIAMRMRTSSVSVFILFWLVPLMRFCTEKPRSQLALPSIMTRAQDARKKRSGYLAHFASSFSSCSHIGRHSESRRFHSSFVRNLRHCATAASLLNTRESPSIMASL